MTDFIVGLAMVLVIEGFVYAAFPVAMKRMLEAAEAIAPPTLRTAGLAAFAVGVGIVWLIRG